MSASTLTYVLGLLGGACFAYCGVPTAVQTYRAGKSVGTPVSVAWMISLGSLFMYSYLFRSYGFDLVLTINYAVELASWGTIVRFHYFNR